MIHDKGRLDQFFLTVLLEEKVDDIALSMTILKLDVMLFCKLFRFFIGFHRIEINAGLFLDGIVHGQTLEWFTEINLNTVVGNLCASAHFLSQITEHALGQLHHALIIGICLV